MSLLDSFLSIISERKFLFSKQPSYRRAILLALASLCVFDHACISRIISFLGLNQQEWSVHYKLFSRSSWKEQDLFFGITKRALPMIDEPYVAIAFDDTKIKKTGKKIKTAFYQGCKQKF